MHLIIFSAFITIFMGKHVLLKSFDQYPSYLEPGDSIMIVAPSGSLSETQKLTLKNNVQKIFIEK